MNFLQSQTEENLPEVELVGK